MPKHFRLPIAVAVIIGLGVLAWLWLLQRRMTRDGEIIRAQGDIRALSISVEVYRALNGFYPTTKQGFGALSEKPTSARVPEHWRKLLDSPPPDPWDRPYVYRYPSHTRPDTFEIFSLGPDGREGTADDVHGSPPSSNLALERTPHGGTSSALSTSALTRKRRSAYIR